MIVAVNGALHLVPFGVVRSTIVIPPLASGLSQPDEDDVRVLRGTTAEEAVRSVSLSDQLFGEME
jgi:hypothetical protein